MSTIILAFTNYLLGEGQKNNLPMSDIFTNKLTSTKNTPLVVFIFLPIIPREGVEVSLSGTTPIHVPLQLFLVQRRLSERIKNRLLQNLDFGNRVGYFLQLTKVEDSLVEHFANERKVSFKLFRQRR